ncbi:MAG: hypothetical protein SGJ00_03250 [bacterium]|nr:hypothetical protein [bacterium]
MLYKLYQGSTAEALQLFNQSALLKEPCNDNLRDIERGLLLFLLHKYEESAKQFIPAEARQENWSTIHYTDVNGFSSYLQDKRFTKDGSPLPPPSKNMDEMFYQGANGVRGSYGQVSTMTLK